MGRVHRTIIHDYLRKTTEAGPYKRYPDISDRKAWDSLSDNLKSSLILAGEKAQKEPWTQLLISDFTEFRKSGNRVRFEDKYFPRRRKLNNLIMAECVENKGRFIDDILDGLYLILEETTWCLPPHTSYERDGEQEKLPDVTRQIIDLFQAESGAEVAYAEFLLRPVFDNISPNISKYVNERLKERIFEPYLGKFFWWMGDGEQTMCNWTPWIVQNVLVCALTRSEGTFSKEELRTFLEKAAVSCDYFLDEYGYDGGCNEGAQYYSHAGLCLFGCLELIDGATSAVQNRAYAEIGDDGNVVMHSSEIFSDVYSETLIRNIATFIVKMHVGGGFYVNFADCSALPGRRTAREFLFGKAIGDEVLASFAAEDFRNESEAEQLICEEINLFYHVMQVFSYDEMMKYPVCSNLPENSWFESMGLMVARNETYTLAAKAGDNGDSHNHNDVGSFTIYKDGKPFVIDLGVGTYTQKTFSDKRYEIWTMQSQFHNLPTFIDCRTNEDNCTSIKGMSYIGNETKYDSECKNYEALVDALGNDPSGDLHNTHIIMQCDGTEYAARNVECRLNDSNNSADRNVVASLKMDIAGAYADERIRKYIREAELVNSSEELYSEPESNADNNEYGVCLGHKVIVRDHYDGDIPAVMSIMTYEKPVIISDIGERPGKSGRATSLEAYDKRDSDAMTVKVGDLGTIEVTGAKAAHIKEYRITDERLGIAWKHSVYRILFELDENAREYEFRFI